MAEFTAIENNNIVIDLTKQCNTTGWTLSDGVNAFHDSCNAGNLPLDAYPVTAGSTYKISYIVLSISGGNVQSQSPGSNGVARTTPGIYVEQLTPTSSGFISFYSNATCEITGFNIQPVSANPGTTIVFATLNNKWSDWRTFYPDFLWSIYTRTVSAFEGQLYTHDNGGDSTNNFYGTPFQSTIQFVEAKNPLTIKDFEVVSYQANMLLITAIDGILSSNGQVSTLIDTDFIKQKLAASGETVTNYQVDNVYSASILGDEGDENIVNGNSMRGNWLIVTLVTLDGSTPLKLFSVAIRSKRVFIGNR